MAHSTRIPVLPRELDECTGPGRAAWAGPGRTPGQAQGGRLGRPGCTMLAEGSCYTPALGVWTHLISVVQVPQQLCPITNRPVERLIRHHSQQQG